MGGVRVRAQAEWPSEPLPLVPAFSLWAQELQRLAVRGGGHGGRGDGLAMLLTLPVAVTVGMGVGKRMQPGLGLRCASTLTPVQTPAAARPGQGCLGRP